MGKLNKFSLNSKIFCFKINIERKITNILFDINLNNYIKILK